MKESFARITAWVKAHPWPAAGILLVVALAAWWSYKQGWFGGGGTVSTVPPSSGPNAGALPVDTSGGGLPLSTGSGGDSGIITTPPAITPAPLPVDTGGASSFVLPAGDNLSNLFGAPVEVTSAPAAPAPSVNLPSAISAGKPLVSESSGSLLGQAVTGSVSVGQQNAGYTPAYERAKAAVTPNPFANVTGSASAGRSGGSTGGATKITRAPAPSAPAQKFTGWIGNTYYINGVPTAGQPSATPSGTVIRRS